MALVDRIDTIFVPATNTEAAAGWYARLFGMTPIFESAGYIGLRLAGGGQGQTALTLYPAETIDRDAHYAFNFSTDDPERLHEMLTNEGLEVTEVKASGPLVYFDFRDISGNWVNICHAPGAN